MSDPADIARLPQINWCNMEKAHWALQWAGKSRFRRWLVWNLPKLFVWSPSLP